MSVEPICPECGGELHASWKVCPFCGAAIANDELVNAPPIPYLDNPLGNSEKLKPESNLWYAETQREGHTDLAYVGIGLIVLGVLGFVGGVTAIFNGSLHQMGTLKGVTNCILFGGGLLIAMVISGTTLIAVSGKKHSTQNIATGIMGGILASFMVAGLVVLTTLAAFIYAIADCLNGCK